MHYDSYFMEILYRNPSANKPLLIHVYKQQLM